MALLHLFTRFSMTIIYSLPLSIRTFPVYSLHKITAVNDVTKLCKDADEISGSSHCYICVLVDDNDTFASTTDTYVSVCSYVWSLWYASTGAIDSVENCIKKDHSSNIDPQNFYLNFHGGDVTERSKAYYMKQKSDKSEKKTESRCSLCALVDDDNTFASTTDTNVSVYCYIWSFQSTSAGAIDSTEKCVKKNHSSAINPQNFCLNFHRLGGVIEQSKAYYYMEQESDKSEEKMKVERIYLPDIFHPLRDVSSISRKIIHVLGGVTEQSKAYYYIE